MSNYHMAWLRPVGRVSLGTTDPSLIDWFLDELKKIVPTYEKEDEQRDLNGKLTYVEVHKLDNKDLEIGFWLLRQLLARGWEPFSVTKTYPSRIDIIEVYLRKEITDRMPLRGE